MFGTNNYDSKSQFVKRNRYKMKDGDNVYRILPSLGDNAADGVWSVYWNVVFGFKTTEGKHRPFQSPLVEKTIKEGEIKRKEILVPCAATALVRSLKGALEEAKKAGDTTKVAQLAKIVGDFPIMGVFSLNNDHYLNVMDRQGNVGQLELGHKAFLALQTEINRIRKDENFDPLAPDTGRFFNLRRTGKSLDTLVSVTVVKDKINVPGVGEVEKPVVHVIDDALKARLAVQKDGKWIYKEAANLNDLFKCPTSEEVALIVKSADITTGKSVGIDKVFPQKNAQQADQAVPLDEAEPAQTGRPQATASAPVTTPTPAVVTVQAAAPVQTTAVVQETKTALAKPAPAAAPAAQTTAETLASMNQDEFMAAMGINL